MPRRRPRLARGASPPADSLCKLIDRAPDVIFRVRVVPRPRVEYVNPAVQAVTGYAPDDWYADAGTALRAVHPGDRRKLQEAARTGKLPTHPIVVRWVRKDGSVVRTEITVVAVRNRQGALVAVEGIARTITKSRTEESPGRGDERFLRAAFEQAPAGLAHLAIDGRFLHVNRRLCEITRFAADELLGRRFPDITQQEDGERQQALLRRLKADEAGSGSMEARCLCKDGAVVHLKVTMSRLQSGEATAECLAVVDVMAPAIGADDEERRLNYSGIEVDTNRLDVLWNGRLVPLTLKEVLLLRYMIRHRGEMLARERLLRDVWGYEHSGRSRTLDVHVCRLRRKLPPLGNALVTIGHFGYTLSEAMAVGRQPQASPIG